MLRSRSRSITGVSDVKITYEELFSLRQLSKPITKSLYIEFGHVTSKEKKHISFGSRTLFPRSQTNYTKMSVGNTAKTTAVWSDGEFHTGWYKMTTTRCSAHRCRSGLSILRRIR